ncbi:MAG: hypothetical protein ACI9EF_001822 [Pseudohongiellaceae bacterium]|jgi:hypothetical protein
MSDSNDAPAVNYGPLAGLIGTWTGDKGLDVAPEPDGSEDSPYEETIVFEATGVATNAEKQNLATVRYLQIVRRKSNGAVFHDQTGYWMWDPAAGVVMQSLTIPRAVCLLAGGAHDGTPADGGAMKLKVISKLGDPDWGMAQSPFMRDNARTVEFSHELTVDGDQLSYNETTVLDIYGRTFQHTDGNQLIRR